MTVKMIHLTLATYSNEMALQCSAIHQAATCWILVIIENDTMAK